MGLAEKREFAEAADAFEAAEAKGVPKAGDMAAKLRTIANSAAAK